MKDNNVGNFLLIREFHAPPTSTNTPAHLIAIGL